MLGTEELIKYMIAQGVKLDADEQAIFKKQKINGEALSDMTQEMLRAEGIPAGVATILLRRIPK